MAKRNKKREKKTSESPQVEKKSEMPDEFNDPQYFIDYVLAAKKEAFQATKERRVKWAELWQLYQNKQDYSNKKEYQAKSFSPKIFMHTIRAAALVERAVLQTATLFKVDIDQEEYEEEEYEDARENARVMERKMKSHLEKTNFAECLGENSISSFLLGLGAVKRRWDDYEPKATFENTDVLNLFISPDYKPFVHTRPKYMVEYMTMDLADLMTKYENNPGNYIKKAIDKLEGDYAKKKELTAQERARRGLSDFSPQDKQLNILEFWGDVVSKDGKKVMRNQLIQVANETDLIRHHDNPFDDELPPWRLSIPIPYPHRGIAGTSLVEGAVQLQYNLNNLLNLYLDNLNFTVNKMFEISTMGLVDPQKARRIYPGKIFLKTTNEKVIHEVGITDVGNEVVQAIRVVDSELRQATAITEYVEALPSKHKQTLGEIEKKTAESHGFFDVIARRMERNLIAPLVKDTYNLILQFKKDYLKGLDGKYIFKVGGLTLMLQQQELKQSINTMLAAVLQNEILAQMTDIPLLWKKALVQTNLQDVYKEPEETEEGMTAADAEEKARQDVGKLPPEEQIGLLRRIKGTA